MNNPMTKLQTTMVRKMASGLHRKELVTEMNLSPRLVQIYITRARQLVKARSDEHLVATALRNGWIQ